MAGGQPAAPQQLAARNFSTSRAASAHKSRKNRWALPLQTTKNSYIRVHPRKIVHPFSYILSAVGGLWGHCFARLVPSGRAQCPFFFLPFSGPFYVGFDVQFMCALGVPLLLFYVGFDV
jgi:hypothetical protein